jgi:hypothetical protein
MTNLFLEAIVVGLVTGIVAIFIQTILTCFLSCYNLNKQQLFICSFLTGFLIHIMFEWTGMNKSFCCQTDRYNCLE